VPIGRKLSNVNTVIDYSSGEQEKEGEEWTYVSQIGILLSVFIFPNEEEIFDFLGIGQ
jgi:hypothetical protein